MGREDGYESPRDSRRVGANNTSTCAMHPPEEDSTHGGDGIYRSTVAL